MRQFAGRENGDDEPLSRRQNMTDREAGRGIAPPATKIIDREAGQEVGFVSGKTPPAEKRDDGFLPERHNFAERKEGR